MTIRAGLLRITALSALLAAAPTVASAQVGGGTLNNFESGTEQGWLINLLGMGTPLPPGVSPTNIATGGPAGVNDNYLQLTSIGGQGPGSRLMALNVSVWPGNYVSAGIAGIRMDVRNFGTSDVQLRIMLERIGPMGPTDIAISSTSRTLAAGGAWQTIEFPILGAGNFFAPLGTVNNALTQAGVLRIYHSGPTGEPVAIAAQIGLDNITAVAVPEPSTVVLFGMGALGLFVAARRRVVK